MLRATAEQPVVRIVELDAGNPDLVGTIGMSSLSALCQLSGSSLSVSCRFSGNLSGRVE